jgi:hypothetical protein
MFSRRRFAAGLPVRQQAVGSSFRREQRAPSWRHREESATRITVRSPALSFPGDAPLG